MADDTPTVPLETVPLETVPLETVPLADRAAAPASPPATASHGDAAPSAPRWEDALRRERSQRRTRVVAVAIVILSVAVILVALRLLLG